MLVEFVLRLCSGLAVALALTPSRWVDVRFYQKHLWVLMGLAALAAVAAYPGADRQLFWLSTAAAGVAWFGSIIWLYGLARCGQTLTLTVAALSGLGAWRLAWPMSEAGESLAPPGPVATLLWSADPASSGLVLGSTMAAMLLGHWYLNNPGMKLEPLRRLVLLIGGAVLLRAVVCGAGLGLAVDHGVLPDGSLYLLVLRWLAGILGAAGVAIATWKVLEIPNTQSATGVLYVGVIVTFQGGMIAQLLSAESPYPL